MTANATQSAAWAADPKSPARAATPDRAGDRQARPAPRPRPARDPLARRPLELLDRTGLAIATHPPGGAGTPAPGKRARSPSAPACARDAAPFRSCRRWKKNAKQFWSQWGRGEIARAEKIQARCERAGAKKSRRG